MNEEQMKNYIFFVCELIKQIIVIIIVLFYTCGYYYTNKVEKKYEINSDILNEINVQKNNDSQDISIQKCNTKIEEGERNDKYNFFDFINKIYEIRNTCNKNQTPKQANEEGSNMIKPNIVVIQKYTHLFSDANLIFGILMIIVYLLSHTLIPKNYNDHINNIFADLVVKMLTVIVFVPILLLYLYSSVYSLVFIFQNIKNTDNLITRLGISAISLIVIYGIMLLFIGFLYLYKLLFKDIYGHVGKRNSLALNIDKTIDIFFNFDAKRKSDKNIAIMNTVFMGVGFVASIGILFNSSSFLKEMFLLFFSPERLPSYPLFFQVIKQFVCDEKSSLVIKNVTRILLSIFVVSMAFQLLPISIAIFALVVVIYLIYKSFSYLMNIEC